MNFFDKNEDELEFTTQPLSIVDIDFMVKKKLLLPRPCGTINGYGYETDKFNISR